MAGLVPATTPRRAGDGSDTSATLDEPNHVDGRDKPGQARP